MLKKLSSAILLAILLLGFAAVLPGTRVAADSLPVFGVWPEQNIFYTNTTNVGDTFTVKLNMTGFTNVWGIEFKLSWDPNLINVTEYSITPPPTWTDIFTAKDELDRDNGVYWYSVVALDGTPFDGDHILAEFTFEILQAPPVKGSVSCALDIYDDIFGDTGGEPIDHETRDGWYEFIYVIRPPTLLVYPPEYTASAVGEEFDIEIYVKDMVAEWELYTANLHLSYDPALLNVVSVTEGPFMTSTGGTTTFDYTVDEVAGTVDITIEYTEVPPAYPEPEGTLAIVRFVAEYGEEGVLLSCPLDLEAELYDVNGLPIDISAIHDGLYKIYVPPPVPKPIFRVIPDVYEAREIGEVFTVEIHIEQVLTHWNITDASIYMTYDPSLLSLVDVTEGDFFSQFFDTAFTVDTSTPGEIYISIENTTEWKLDLEGNLMIPEGEGSFAFITFEAIAGELYPTELSCPLDLHDAIVLGFNEESGQFEDIGVPDLNLIDGLYKITCIPVLAVSPEVYEAKSVGEVFTINVVIRHLDERWQLWGAEFKLAYDTELLDVVDVEEGPFLASFGYRDPPTFKVISVDEEAGIVHVTVLLIDGAPIPPDLVYPHTEVGEEGVIASITFIATKGEPAVEYSCPLDLYDVVLGDINGEPVPSEDPIDGLYKIFFIGRQIDVYTQYPSPYGGQGPNNPSDPFAPQDLVCLTAHVTYNEWPVEGKLVTFTFETPGYPMGMVTAETDENGYATFCFRIPWPYDKESVLGIWKVTASVDIAQETVTDTITFKVGYIVELKSVTTDKDSYAHGETVEITIEAENIASTTRRVVFSIQVFDELNVPVASLSVETFIDPGTHTYTFSVVIPDWAYAGLATAVANAFTDWPEEGGVAYCPSVSTQFHILAE